MKKFLIHSPAYKYNGFDGTYYSLAITDDEGNVIQGIGDHFFEDEKLTLKNVIKAQGQSFTDDGRPIEIREVEFDREEFEKWIKSYRESVIEYDKWHEKRLSLFEGQDPYTWVYGNKEKTKEREKILEDYVKENPVPQRLSDYGFLKLIKK